MNMQIYKDKYSLCYSYYLRQGDYVFGNVCLSVCLLACLSHCKQHYLNSYEWIVVNFYGGVWGGKKNKW